MSIERRTGKGIFGQEDAEEESTYVGFFQVSETESVEAQRLKKAKHVYETFIDPVLDDLEDEFSIDDVSSEIRPPYSDTEIREALDHAVNHEEVYHEFERDLYTQVK